MNERNMMKKIALLGTMVIAASCVDHRPIRNGLRDESIYLTKEDLTKPNPKMGEGSTDDGWLMRTTIVAASSPNPLLDWAFVGLQGPTNYVKFRFREEAIQIVNAIETQYDDPEDPNDDLATRTERVLLEFAGSNVDIKLRESLDGERTNWLEENTEEPWQSRQKFKVDFEKSSLDPLTALTWIYGQVLKDCAQVSSVNLVPDSYEWDGEDQYMSFVLEVNYNLNLFTYLGGCYDLVSLTADATTATIQYRFSFYRPGPSTYKKEEIAEKDLVNKKYGTFQTLNLFRDHDSGLLGAVSYLGRWNPDREDPVVWYFDRGFPQKFKPIFDEIKANTNQVLADAGAKLRVDFKDFDGGGIERKRGDLRYNFIVWNEDLDVSWGPGGYGPMSMDPRTGEFISANVNIYNGTLEYWRYLVQTYLEENGGPGQPDPEVAWEDTPCTPGETTAAANELGRFRSTLFEEIRRTMDMPELTETSTGYKDFVPTPVRDKAAFNEDYVRLLHELRYSEPGWNTYVWAKGPDPLEGLADRLKKEHEFENAMNDILMNQDPFEGIALYSRPGVEKQLDFMEQFRDWKRNHHRVEVDDQMVRGMNNIYNLNPGFVLASLNEVARECKDSGFWESNREYSDRLEYAMVQLLAVHEFGHNLSLRHNFYGSVDAAHVENDHFTTSVMDYSGNLEWVLEGPHWQPYDRAALTWIYGTPEKRDEVMQENFLYCTDEHRSRSPLCDAYDVGFTPAEIVLNAIERYDWLYSLRNRRAFRKFWDTRYYIGGVYNSIFPILRMWYLAIFDWGGGGIQDTLKRLDQIDPNRQVLTDQEYDDLSLDYYNDVSAAIELTMAFYDAVINEPASFRNYQTEFDPYYGDVLRLGIIIDKLFTTFAFMDLQEVYDYDPNVYTYVSMYDAPFGGRNWALSRRVLDGMLGSNYDTFPWFKYYSIGIFSAVTNTNLFGSLELKERIAIQRFDTKAELEEAFGAEAIARATDRENTTQIFIHDGEEYVYTFLPDRQWHLVAGKSRNPVSYQYMKDYNESLNAEASETLDNFGLKILLAYYEYYNNFQGF